MRENTRWEVEEPISTPTLNTQISSSPSRLRPVVEKKIRPPASSVSISIQLVQSAPFLGRPRLPEASSDYADPIDLSLPGLTGQSSTHRGCLLDRPVGPGDDSEGCQPARRMPLAPSSKCASAL